MKKITRFAFLISIAAITTSLLGCNNPKAANKENFAKVITEEIAKNPYQFPNNGYRCEMNLGKMPIEISSEWGSDGFSFIGSQGYEALAKAGLLTSQVVGEVEKTNVLNTGYKITITKYDLSDKGKQIAKEDNGTYSLPYCKIGFKEIKLFTEPSDGEGITYSKVDYTVVVEKVEDWVKNPEILKNVPYVQRFVDLVGKPQDIKQLFQLTNEGWVVQD